MPIKNLRPSLLLAIALLMSTPATAQQESEIRIGNIMPYTGPLAAFAAIGRAEAAYFDMINERGGINGRKIKFISVDNSSSPRDAVERTRELVEKEKVLFMFGSFGTPDNLATRQYLNEKKIPQLFIASGDEEWAHPRRLSVDDGMAAGIPDRGPGVRKLYPGRLSRSQDRGALGE